MSFLVGFCLGILSADFLLNDGKITKIVINKIRFIWDNIKNLNNSKID